MLRVFELFATLSSLSSGCLAVDLFYVVKKSFGQLEMQIQWSESHCVSKPLAMKARGCLKLLVVLRRKGAL